MILYEEEHTMKMVVAIVRPDKLKDVQEDLKDGGIFALTEMSVRGRGKQQGITIGNMKYEKLPKEMMLIVCKNEDVKKITDIITKSAKTGNIGDGKIFILNVDDAITIRTGEKE